MRVDFPQHDLPKKMIVDFMMFLNKTSQNISNWHVLNLVNDESSGLCQCRTVDSGLVFFALFQCEKF